MLFLYRTMLMALKALSRNVMRSALTTLGIVIGIAAVIAMVEIGQGASRAVQQTIASMGANNLLIRPGTASSGGVSFGAGSVMTLTPDDANALADPERCPGILASAPIVRARTQVIYGNKNWVPIFIYGTTPDYLAIREWEDLEEGNPFAMQDVLAMREVCLIGTTIKKELFDNESPLGQQVRINNKPFTVVGVLSSKGANMMGMDQDDVVIAPWTTIKFKVVGQSASTGNQSGTATTTDPSQKVNTLSVVYPNQPLPYPVPSPLQQADTPVTPRFVNVDQILVQ